MALSILDGNQTAVTLATTVSGGQHFPNHIIASGTVTANLSNTVTATYKTEIGGINAVPIVFAKEGANGGEILGYDGSNTSLNVNIKGSLPSLVAGTAQIGSVTANSSNGELTTRFGSITTANTAFSTTAVTNTSRKYLMIQNIATTVITAGIGFTPTTTQGIQIVAGATITFDGNYIPTGAVRILSSVTASNFTVLEA